MICPKCGTNLPDGSSFCGACGTPFAAQGAPSYAPPQQPTYNNYGAAGQDTSALSVGQCIVTFIVAGIPIVGFIMLIVWAVDKVNVGRSNLAKAMLIILVVVVVLSIILSVAATSLVMTMFDGVYGY